MEWRLRGGRGSGFDAPAGFGYEDGMRSALRLPVVAGPWLVAMAVAGSLAAGEAMRESGPSRSKGSLDRNGRPSDPLLERLVNPSPLKAGRDDSSLVNPLLAPKPNTGSVDPLLQKQWNREIEKQRNWLLENATKIAEPDRPGLGREPDRMLPNGKARLGPEAPASLRYLQARDAASTGAMRRLQGDGQDGTGPSTAPDAAVPSLQGPERGLDRPLDTARIVQLGGDSAAAGPGRSTGAGPAFSALRDVATPSLPGALPGGAEEARKTLMEERTSAFATLLDSQPSAGLEGNASTARAGASAGGASAAGPDALSIVGIEPRRTASSRAQQFDVLLAGPETPVSSLANTAARPNPAASLPAASRGTGLPELARPGGTPVVSPAVKPVTRTPERRFQGQPAILELPRFNQ